ncbi:hypothetical protein Tco_0683552 [Tanacetum coccineum]
MGDNRTMAQLLEAPTEGYEDAIVIPEITANNFEIKHGLLNLSKVRQSRNKLLIAKMSTSLPPKQSHLDVAELKTWFGALILDRLLLPGPKAFNHDTEVTKDTMPPANNGSTEDVQPPVVQIQTRNPNPEPNVAPVVTPVPKASIPFHHDRNVKCARE